MPSESIKQLDISLRKMIDAQRKHKRVPVRKLAKLVGQLVWHITTNPMIKPFLHHAQAKIQSGAEKSLGWGSQIYLTKAVVEDFTWLLEIIQSNKGVQFELDSDLLVLKTDASPTGYGGTLLDTAVVGFWNEKERSMHINLLELMAVKYVLVKLINQVARRQLHLYVDSQVALTYLKKGSGVSQSLRVIAKEIWIWCYYNQVSLRKVTYIRSKENVESDALSRATMKDLSDWGLSSTGWDLVSQNLGPFTIDRFATVDNKKVSRFCSQGFEETALTHDAFLDTWTNEENFVCPPLGLIIPVISHVIRHKAKITIILPEWEQAIWWPVILVLKTKEIKLAKSIHLTGHPDAEIWRNPSWRFVAVVLEGGLWENWKESNHC